MKQQDCLELNGHRAGMTPSNRECARNTATILKRRRTAEACYPSQDKFRLARKIPNRKAAAMTPSSSVRKSVKRWDGIQRTTTVWDSLRRVRDLAMMRCSRIPTKVVTLGFRAVVSFRGLSHPFLRTWSVETWRFLASVAGRH
jgi:hypothetical protein